MGLRGLEQEIQKPPNSHQTGGVGPVATRWRLFALPHHQ